MSEGNHVYTCTVYIHVGCLMFGDSGMALSTLDRCSTDAQLAATHTCTCIYIKDKGKRFNLKLHVCKYAIR